MKIFVYPSGESKRSYNLGEVGGIECVKFISVFVCVSVCLFVCVSVCLFLCVNYVVQNMYALTYK